MSQKPAKSREPGQVGDTGNGRHRLVRIAGLIALLLAMVLILSWLADIQPVLGLLGRTTWWLLAPATGCLLIAYGLQAWYWQQALAATITRPGNTPTKGPAATVGPGRKLADDLAITSLSSLLAKLTPLPDISLKVITTGKAINVSMTDASTAAVIERVLMIVVRLIILVLAVMLFAWQDSDSLLTLVLAAGAIAGALTLIFWVVRHPDEAIAKVASLQRLPYSHRMPLDKMGAKSEKTGSWSHR